MSDKNESLRMTQGEDGPDVFDCQYADAARQCGCGFCRALNSQPPRQDRGEVEQRARELLETYAVGRIRRNDGLVEVGHAIDAITAALTEAKR